MFAVYDGHGGKQKFIINYVTAQLLNHPEYRQANPNYSWAAPSHYNWDDSNYSWADSTVGTEHSIQW